MSSNGIKPVLEEIVRQLESFAKTDRKSSQEYDIQGFEIELLFRLEEKPDALGDRIVVVPGESAKDDDTGFHRLRVRMDKKDRDGVSLSVSESPSDESEWGGPRSNDR